MVVWKRWGSQYKRTINKTIFTIEQLGTSGKDGIDKQQWQQLDSTE
jgi:hypothetical protein